MSYDINFWRQPAGFPLTPEETYTRLCSGEKIEGLIDLPVDEISAELQKLFLHYDPTGQDSLMHSPEQERDKSGSVEVFSSPKLFRFDLRGESTEAFNLLVELMARFGCPLYDPQENKRYATEDGTAVAEVPRQEPLSEEKKAEIERIQAQFLAKLGLEQSGTKKRGCGAAALMLVGSAGSVIAAVVGLT